MRIKWWRSTIEIDWVEKLQLLEYNFDHRNIAFDNCSKLIGFLMHNISHISINDWDHWRARESSIFFKSFENSVTIRILPWNSSFLVWSLEQINDDCMMHDQIDRSSTMKFLTN
jgi:hypothetical protein